MKDPALKPVINPLSEARRYVANAKQTLQEHGQFDPDEKRYDDPKYVKAAGNYLWLAVLLALDAVFHVKKSKKKGARVDVDDYKAAVAQRDRKLLNNVNDAYNILHLDMTYDGISNKDLCDLGFRLANDIIDRCSLMIPSHVA